MFPAPDTVHPELVGRDLHHHGMKDIPDKGEDISTTLVPRARVGDCAVVDDHCRVTPDVQLREKGKGSEKTMTRLHRGDIPIGKSQISQL